MVTKTGLEVFGRTIAEPTSYRIAFTCTSSALHVQVEGRRSQTPGDKGDLISMDVCVGVHHPFKAKRGWSPLSETQCSSWSYLSADSGEHAGKRLTQPHGSAVKRSRPFG